MQLEGGPLLSDWWVETAGKIVPYLNVTARWDGAPDQGLLSEKGGRGFPFCGFMDAKGRMIFETRPGSAEGFKAAHEKAVRLDAHLQAFEAGKIDAKGAAEMLALYQEGMGQRGEMPSWLMDPLLAREDAVGDAARALQEKMKLIAEWEKTWQKAVRTRDRSQAYKNVVELYEAGTLPPEGWDQAYNYWYLLTNGAIEGGKVDLAKKALAKTKAGFEAAGLMENPGAKNAYEGLVKKVEEMGQDG